MKFRNNFWPKRLYVGTIRNYYLRFEIDYWEFTYCIKYGTIGYFQPKVTYPENCVQNRKGWRTYRVDQCKIYAIYKVTALKAILD
jgi:hypothetical protein